MAKTIPIGIDLGTTNSAMATIDKSGSTVMIGNAEGDLLTPSVVLFDEDEVVVGKEARKANTVNPDKVAQWVKRDMGLKAYSHPIQGRFLPPEVIEACILRKLKADLSKTFGAKARVVITVPAYFDEPRRDATANAGEMAGLSVLDIVNEPMAAALAFGETLGYLSPSNTPKEKLTVLVYDLGGGTFDATLLNLTQGNVQTLATDGDVQLGGYDWDEQLADYLAEQLVQQHGVDPRQDPAGKNRLLNAVVEVKHALSARSKTTVRLAHEGHGSDIEVTREKFEELTAGLLERTAYTCRQLLVAASMQWSDVSRVLLVGGSTRMPMVANMLQQMTGLTPDHSVNPDEAVARGAALYASYMLSKGVDGGDPSEAQPVNFNVTNVNSHSLGVAGIEPETLLETNVIIIPRNTPLPVNRTERFTTKREGQSSIVVQVIEGESSMPEQCTAIGRTVIRDLPLALPQGWPIEVTFEYGANGRLHVKAVVPGTHSKMSLTLERAVGLSSEKMSRWKQIIANAAGSQTFQAIAAEQPVTAEIVGDQAAGTLPGGPEKSLQPAQPETGEDAGADAGKNAGMTLKLPDWASGLVGYLVSAAVSLAIGYLVLSFLRPDIFPVPW
jgi:molecular chaperone DnaK